MANELMPQCGVCGSRGTHKVGAETAAPAVGCHCGVIVTGFTEAEATERWERLARRAEIGALVERIVGEDNMVKVWIDKDDPWTAESYKPKGLGYTRVQIGGETLLDALRALAKEVGCE